MRVRRSTYSYIPSMLSLEDLLSVEDGLKIAAPIDTELPGAVFNTDIFSKLKPGDERTCIILRTDGYNYVEIGQIMGKTESQVKNIVYTIRKRLTNGIPKIILDPVAMVSLY